MVEPCLGLDASESARLKQNMLKSTGSEQAPDQSNMRHDCMAIVIVLCTLRHGLQGPHGIQNCKAGRQAHGLGRDGAHVCGIYD